MSTAKLAEKVIHKYPTAYAKEWSRFDGENMQYTYRIVDHHLNELGKGSTDAKAWKDAGKDIAK